MDARTPWRVVEEFERAIAAYCGAAHAVVVDSCTNALSLCFWRKRFLSGRRWASVNLPKLTYVGVAQAARNAGYEIQWTSDSWVGEYRIDPLGIVDAARWLRRDMHQRGMLTCLSFQVTKHLPIGRGGAILCDAEHEAEWFRRARFDGRDRTKPLMEQREFQFGIHAYLEPAAAARGLWLLASLPDDNQPLPGQYFDLSTATFT